MNKKLSILVPQYKETDEIIKPLLDSIAMQKSVNFDDIEVIICNDGTDVHLSESLLNSYPYHIEYHLEKHEGVSATRNKCLEYAHGEYVSWSDADDCYFSVCALWIVFREMGIGFDGLIGNFVEQTKNPANGETVFVDHPQNRTFVHGGYWRKQYLEEKDIKFNPALQIHEDSYFVILASSCSTNVKYCPTQLYLWCWRDDSVCRHDPKYILKTYNNMIDSNDALIDNFIRRGMQDKAMFYTAFLIWDSYYLMNKPEWRDQENKTYRKNTELRFKKYYKKRKAMWDALPVMDKMQISNGVRGRIINEGMLAESMTIDQWLAKIEKLK